MYREYLLTVTSTAIHEKRKKKRLDDQTSIKLLGLSRNDLPSTRPPAPPPAPPPAGLRTPQSAPSRARAPPDARARTPYGTDPIADSRGGLPRRNVERADERRDRARSSRRDKVDRRRMPPPPSRSSTSGDPVTPPSGRQRQFPPPPAPPVQTDPPPGGSAAPLNTVLRQQSDPPPGTPTVGTTTPPSMTHSGEAASPPGAPSRPTNPPMSGEEPVNFRQPDFGSPSSEATEASNYQPTLETGFAPEEAEDDED